MFGNKCSAALLQCEIQPITKEDDSVSFVPHVLGIGASRHNCSKVENQGITDNTNALPLQSRRKCSVKKKKGGWGEDKAVGFGGGGELKFWKSALFSG